MCSYSFTPKNIEWRGVEYIKYLASPKLGWRGGGKGRLYGGGGGQGKSGRVK
jgi:hypothetical protein